jgi:exodeoxyribonuclease V beta subunit
LTPDTLVDPAIKTAAHSELLAEKLRLAYVALTRAEHRQYVAWGWVQKMETAALSWLLHAPLNTTIEDLPNLTHSQVMQDLQHFISKQDDAACLLPAEPAAALALVLRSQQHYQAQTLTRALYTPWRVTSFTGLAQHGAVERERPDHDRGLLVPLEAEPSQEQPFPRGARAGTCLHAILEQIDFTAPSTQILATVRDNLAYFGFDPACEAAAADLITHTLTAQLAPGVSLSQVARGKRLVELEFMLPVGRLRAESLRAVLTDADNGLDAELRQAAQSLDFSTVRGFFKGFIDLVFEQDGLYYLVDYKSNYLGADFSDYGRDGLARSVAKEHYYLQYLLYCVAIRRYFLARGVDFDARFAGVRYLYMRGLNTQGYGIWIDRPSAVLLDRLDALFAV